MKRTLALIGPRCAGKSCVGVLVAERLGVPFVDLDVWTVAMARRAGNVTQHAGELLERVGRGRFRAFEAAALRAVLEPALEVVLATGGGVVERTENRAWLRRSAAVIWLDASPATSARRMAEDSAPRPALLPGGDAESELEELARRREPLYRELARARVATDDINPAAVCEEVCRVMGRLDPPA